jgi:hypothetical protein
MSSGAWKRMLSVLCLGSLALPAAGQESATPLRSPGTTTVFDELVEVSPERYRPLRGSTLREDPLYAGVQLPGALLGQDGEELPFAFGHEVRRIRVYQVPGGAALVLLAGGVRSELSVHVLRRDGLRRSLRFAGGRIVPGLGMPVVDRDARLCAVLFQREGRILLRVFALDPLTPRLLLARELELVPERFRLETLTGSARILVRLGSVRLRAPGSQNFESPGQALGFLHPLARFPVPDPLRVDFGDVVSREPVERVVRVRNPGELPLQLAWGQLQGSTWSLRVEPTAFDLAPGAAKELRLRLEALDAKEGFQRRLPLFDSSRQGDPLLELLLEAELRQRADEAPPSFDAKRIELRLLDAQRIAVKGRPGAVRDDSMPVEIIAVRGQRVQAAEDGSFELTVERNVEGRVVLIAKDALGQSSSPVLVGRVRDEDPPRVERSKLHVGPLTMRGFRLSADAGALADLTPPLRLELRIDGRRRVLPERPGLDGSFRATVPGSPGAELILLVDDAAVPRNRARVPLGRLLPYLERAGGELTLHGQPWARFRLRSFTGASDGAEPVELARWAGTLDGKGRASFALERLRGGVLLLLELEQLPGGRFGALELPVPQK